MFTSKEEFKEQFRKGVLDSYGRPLEESHMTEQFVVLERMTRVQTSKNWADTKKCVHDNEQKEVHYFSMEFLMGRLLTNNLMNMGYYEMVKEGLADLGINIHDLEDLERDPGLGNGGLGRLAACFLDSLASSSLPGHGNTIRYQFGLFKQKMVDGYQTEIPDQWMSLTNKWEIRKSKHMVDVKFWGRVVWDEQTGKFTHVDAECIRAVPYDIPIVGNDTFVTNTLRMWSSEVSDNIPTNKDFRQYSQEVNEICQNLYPDDSTQAGRVLRLKQQYFFVSAGVQAIVKAHLRQYPNLDNFHEKHTIQLNDTHPVLAIPELMRILVDEYDYEWLDAWSIVKQTMAYTNHTILSEALEKWPVDIMRALLPRVYMMIEEINRRFTGFVKEVADNPEEVLNHVRIIKDDQVHMAHLAIAGSYSVNGVARIHTNILINSEMKHFATLYPNKFNNKTNGITHRRWLAYSNLPLRNLLKETIGEEWIHNPDKLEDLMAFVDDPKIQEQFLDVKKQKKEELAAYIKEHNGVEVDVNSIFDIQVKRLHAYKRQLLNVMHIIYLYQEMKRNPEFRIYPRTFIFGAKAAPAYFFAKKVIKLITSVGDVVNNDPVTKDYLKVIFVENYGVTLAEMIMPAADVSEQISTAGKEASGTGNMKFMMNGAITVGTLDGANVEIHELVGDDNCAIFGLTEEQVQETYRSGTYSSWDIYHNDFRIKTVIDSLLSTEWGTSSEEFRGVFEELMNHNDQYLLLADFDSYVKAQKRVEELYKDRTKWARICLVNIAKSGYFSSDRTIGQYAKEIWHIEPVKKL
ncbi:glycogen/starch/alpha-glucan phosphorylase [Tannockella kyphosi]|uniref:glycogen/starch/alpha-glucan phosphorylase n=1 Tax=Tannockella kyphosi TaxID=2899121 RepID=UPI002012E559|nr:glycogen/starch/alpha-glucan phosphorylase [Tannockella kyphosi]